MTTGSEQPGAAAGAAGAAALYPEFFNDVFGPVMQPGSSSHTAGPCRLGRLAADLLGEPLRAARIVLDEHGSFAGTFGIMAEDRAMVAGVLGLLPDDERLFRSFELAAERGVRVQFAFESLTESGHPNAIKFELTGAGGSGATLVGVSTGGGMVETVLVDGLPLAVKGDTWVLLLRENGADEPLSPALLESLTAGLEGAVEIRGAVGAGGAVLHAVRLAQAPELEAIRAAAAPALPGLQVSLLRPLLPVVTQPDHKPQLFATMTAWRELAARRGLSLSEVAVQYEMDASGWPRERVVEHMRGLAALMRRQTRAAYDEQLTVPTSPFKADFTAGWAAHAATPARVTGGVAADTITRAYGAGAGIPGVVTVPGPMGGGAATCTPP